jgi:probable phosphoglycerate mutase
LAQKIRDFGIEKIFCSPRIRAQETAAILQKELNCPIEILQDIRERNHYGILTDMVKAEAKEKYPELVSLLKDTHNTIEGGEAYEPFVARVKRGLVTIEGSDLKIVAIITHGGPIRVIFREILKIGEISVDDCAFAELEADHRRLKAVRLDGIELRT